MDASVVGFFNPGMRDPVVRPQVLNGWPLHRLSHAAAFVAAYLAVVFGCRAAAWLGAASTTASSSEGQGRRLWALQVGIVAYNAAQVALCGWMAGAALLEHGRRRLSFFCNPVDREAVGMAWVGHVFYCSKYLDFCDTFFMIAKGNWRQVSFLHVYHHASIVAVAWVISMSAPDGDVYFVIVANSLAHVLTYGYYLATSLGLRVPRLVKQAVTRSQLTQFFCIEVHAGLVALHGCAATRVMILENVYVATMIILFLDFSNKAYNSNSKKH